MKSLRILIIAVISTLSLTSAKAQTFPVFEDFESYTAFQVPTDFTGDISVYLTHGTFRSKGLASNMNQFNTNDSIITPPYGPIDGGTVLLFDWRIVLGNLYPNLTVNLVQGDEFEVLGSSDGVNYQSLTLVDVTNFVPDTNFTSASLSLNIFAGDIITLKFRVQRGNNPDDYWVDVDNILMFDVTSVAALTSKDISFFPTIVSDRLNFQLSKPINGAVEIYSMTGKLVKTERIEDASNGSFDLSGLAAGSYIVKLLGNGSLAYHFEKR